MIYWFNEAAAIAACLVLIWAARGFLPHLRIQDWRTRAAWRNPNTWMTLVVVGMDVKGLLRMSYWDIYRPFRSIVQDDVVVVGTIEGTLVNGGINMFALCLGLMQIAVLYYAIPADRRGRGPGRWSYWMAPLYPNGLPIWRVIASLFRRS